ncbi:FAD-dependent oxidoreductase [Janibacter sp. GXQ6167]|uniref:FAD-dependent oxidoreductase n=1 Tax=Janibacter sp. GXQ6167 TaxID=3240791 RepID=UPI0035232D32
MRVVVIGAGMVGARFAEDLISQDAEGRITVTVLKGEPGPSYNRVLLSDVVSGRASVESIMTEPMEHPRLRWVSSPAAAVDRADRVVFDAGGGRHRYDFLVFATGAEAVVPQWSALREGRPEGLHVLRSLSDATSIVEAAANARHATVVGGGVLGLEVATGLSDRRLQVDMVHPVDSVMHRQLGAIAGGVVGETIGELGIGRHFGTTVRDLVCVSGRVVAVTLSDGRSLDTDCVVVTAGTAPRTALAASCGLPIDRGIVVGADLASPRDRRVFAIGDCAAPPEGGAGLVAQGWAQADRLASRLLRRLPAPETAAPSLRDDVVKVKSRGLDVVTMGITGESSREANDRVITLSDPTAGRHVEIITRSGRLIGATCIGAGDLATRLVVTYTRGEMMPTDPAHVMLPIRQAQEASTDLVCRCSGVGRRDIAAAIDAGAASLREVSAATRAGTGCGGCRDEVCAILADLTVVSANA